MKTKKRNIELDIQYRSFEINRENINEEKRTIDLSFSSEAPVERWFGVEILDHKPSSVMLDRLKRKAPFLLDHDRTKQIGVVELASVSEGRGRATVRLSKAAHADEIFQDVKDDIRVNVSVGYRVHEMKLEKQDKDGPDTYRVIKWEPIEISLVSIPADISVGVGREVEMQPVKIIIERGTEMPEEIKNTVTEPQVPASPEPSKIQTPFSEADREAEINKIRNSETARIAEITKMGEDFNMKDDARQAIQSGVRADEFRKKVIDKINRSRNIVGNDGKTISTIGMERRDVEKFSFLRLLRAQFQHGANWRAGAGFEAELSDEVAKKINRDPRGCFIPDDVLFSERVIQMMNKWYGKRELTQTTASSLIGTDHLASQFIDLLRNKAVMLQIGVRSLQGLQGNVSIPKQSGAATFYWVADSGDITASDQTFTTVTMSPKTGGAATLMSRNLMLQSDPSIEALVLDDLLRVMALGVDQAILRGTGASNQPTGIINTSGIGSVDGTNINWAKIVEFETDVADNNADIDSMRYVMRASVRGVLKTREKASNTGIFLMNNNEVNGYPAAITNQMESGKLLFGAFSQALVGFWGGLDVLVDPYTSAADGGKYLWCYQDIDVAVRHAAAFSYSDNVS